VRGDVQEEVVIKTEIRSIPQKRVRRAGRIDYKELNKTGKRKFPLMPFDRAHTFA
jgi:hypothetical protein